MFFYFLWGVKSTISSFKCSTDYEKTQYIKFTVKSHKSKQLLGKKLLPVNCIMLLRCADEPTLVD